MAARRVDVLGVEVVVVGQHELDAAEQAEAVLESFAELGLPITAVPMHKSPESPHKKIQAWWCLR